MTKMWKIIAAFAFFAKNSCLSSEYTSSDKENRELHNSSILSKSIDFSSVPQKQLLANASKNTCDQTLNGSLLFTDFSFGSEAGHSSYATDWSEDEFAIGNPQTTATAPASNSKRKRSSHVADSHVLSPLNSPLTSPQKMALRSPTKKRTKLAEQSISLSAQENTLPDPTPSAKRKLCFEDMAAEEQRDTFSSISDGQHEKPSGIQATGAHQGKDKRKKQRKERFGFITPEEALTTFKYNFMAHQASEKSLAETYLPIPKELRGDEGTTFPPLILNAAGNLAYEGTRSQRRLLNQSVPGLLASPVKPYHAPKRTPAYAPKEFTVDPSRAKHTRASYALEQTILWQEKTIEQVFEPLLIYLKGCSDQGASPSLMAVTEILFTKLSEYFDCKVDIEDEQFWLSSYQLTNQRNKAFLPQNLQRMSQGQNPILDGETGHAHHVTQKTLCGPGSQLKEIVIYVPASFHHNHSELLHRFLDQGEETHVHGIWSNEWNNRRKQANMELHAQLSKKVDATLLPKS
ncbi:MAG: hypothetical protein ACK5O7_02030 [Holosporales bacterium]